MKNNCRTVAGSSRLVAGTWPCAHVKVGPHKITLKIRASSGPRRFVIFVELTRRDGLIYFVPAKMRSTPKVVAIIPARYGSTRFPGKVLAELCAKPMIQRVWERAKMASLIDEVVVATDDERVAEVVSGFGGRVIMTMPEHQTGAERVAEAANKIKSDIVVNLQGDEPMIHPQSLDLAIQPILEEESIAMASLKHPIASCTDYLDPNVVKVVCDDQENSIYFSRAPIPWYRDGESLMKRWKDQGERPDELVPVPMKHIGVYAFRADFLQAMVRMPRSPLETAEALEQLRVLAWGFKIRIITTPHDSVGVDVPQDVEKVEALIREEEEGK